MVGDRTVCRIDPDALGPAYEAQLSPALRRARGAHYTPSDVCDQLVTLALGEEPMPQVCDPSCGGGAFLLAAGRALERLGLGRDVIARELLWGLDVDADAVRVAREAIVEWSGVDPGAHLVVADALTFDGWRGRFDVVVGNPPFQNQLERATVRADGALPPYLLDVAGAYSDTAWLFLLVGLRLARCGGRVVLIQPQSIAAARDARAIRTAVERQAVVNDMWISDGRVFDANVEVCAPVLVKGEGPTAPTATWGPLLESDGTTPRVSLDTSSPTVRSLATATAGFRQHFYGLTDAVIDARDVPDERAEPKLMTSGLIDAAGVSWGVRAARFTGRTLQHPRVALGRIPDARVREWVEQRLVPKLVVATQTRVIEAAVDRDGTWVPSVPVIAVHPNDPDDLDAIAAVLLAPPVSALAASRYAGAALSAKAIKLSASQVLDLPLPPDSAGWAEGTVALRAGELHEAAAAMTRAYGEGEEVLHWWTGRSGIMG
jgi:hypothetical protein